MVERAIVFYAPPTPLLPPLLLPRALSFTPHVARPLPAAALLAMVIATGNGVLVVAFAPAFVPLDWVAIARGGRPNAGEVRGGSHGSWWTQAAAGGGVVGDGDGGGGVARGRRRRGRRESGFLRSGQVCLQRSNCVVCHFPKCVCVRAGGQIGLVPCRGFVPPCVGSL